MLLGTIATERELEQVRITNEYRMLLGRVALAVDGRLVAAARGHSKEMRALNYFDHVSPTESERNPEDRIARAGLKNVAVGENIAAGYDSARAVFEGWYTSAPHHRNMLETTWTRMGAGADGDHWTQNFAGG